MDYLLVLLFLFLLIIPGLYLATKKYFIYCPNTENNTYLYRAAIAVPSMAAYSFFLSMLLFFIVYLAGMNNTPDSLSGTYDFLINGNGILSFPTISGAFLILFYGIFRLRKDIPPECFPDFFDHDYYLFSPPKTMLSMYEQFDGAHYSTKYDTLPADKYGMRLKMQKEDLILSFFILDKINSIVSTADGCLIVNEIGMDILNRYEMTGINFRHVTPFNNEPSDRFHKFFQVECLHVLPEMSPRTKILKKRSPAIVIPDNMIYYPESLKNNLFDFNLTSEIFSETRSKFSKNANRRMWIVSKKGMFVLIKLLGYEKRSFIPVYFVEDSEN